ncbi:MAG TPA: ParB/RepB/Spo0J family partition protein [Anaeromyxobacteraceae bacterium]|nr:ParB/RepB/Spo0J family partition protein [Anaeromyxobacteraceae bacterium]
MTKPPDNPRKALGRGLTSLLVSRTAPKPEAAPHTAVPATPPSDIISRVPLDLVDPNPLQPRTAFQPDRLQELADSIRANGIIQPLVVRPRDGRYQLVAGERRWRAARIAGIAEVPVSVQDVPDDRLLEITLVENIQREDLNPIEVAHAFDRLARDLHLSHDEIARRTGKDRTSITNTLRLLKLPTDIQTLVAEHRLSMGHARAILGLPTEELQRQVAEKASSQGLSVRQVEHLVQRMTAPREAKSVEEALDPNVKAAVQELERVLGTRVKITGKPDARGHIEIAYYSPDDLQRIYALIVGEEQ